MWLILLPGEGFADAQAQSSLAPYLVHQLIPQGTLLSSYSPLAAGALAQDTALLFGHGAAPAQVTWLAAPGCDPAANCAPGSPAELAADDRYLSSEIPRILAGEDYRRHGLIVLAFVPATTTLPTGPTGALLLSPFLRDRSAGTSTTPFHPASPKKDLERLFKG